MDVTQYIKAKSDQLNADDLIGGHVIVKIMGVKEGSAEQPVIVEIDKGYQPYKPCKTDRRVLVAIWGPDASQWVGRRLALFRDPDVVYGGVAVGGVRISRMSHMKGEVTLLLSSKRGKKSPRVIKPLPDEESAPAEKKAPAKMSDEEFLKRLTVAKANIEAGKVTSNEVIEKIEAAVLLTEAQREELETLKPQTSEPETGAQAGPEDGMFD